MDCFGLDVEKVMQELQQEPTGASASEYQS